MRAIPTKKTPAASLYFLLNGLVQANEKRKDGTIGSFDFTAISRENFEERG